MGNLEPINPNSKIAYYLQVKDALQKKIENSDFKLGEKMPSEEEMCRQFKVSRTVVRQALMELEHEGLISKRRGKGTFVAEPKVQMALAQLKKSFIETMTEKGKEVTTQVLFQDLVPATRKVAQYLHIQEGEPVLQVDRLRFLNKEPFRLIHSYFAYKHCPALVHADFTKKVYDVIRNECKLEYEFGERMIESVGANGQESEIFGVRPGTPMIATISVNYTADLTPIEYANIIMPGDRSRIEIRVTQYRDADDNLNFLTTQSDDVYFSVE
ncbi:MAG: GntR family transcriptional regulator [Anaerolineaceae bacterium]